LIVIVLFLPFFFIAGLGVTSEDCIIRDAVFAAATVVVEDVIGTTTFTAFFATANDDDDNEDEEIIAPPPPAAARGGGEDVFVDGDRLRYGLAITIVNYLLFWST
jgi:hypothetical protein